MIAAADDENWAKHLLGERDFNQVSQTGDRIIVDSIQEEEIDDRIQIVMALPADSLSTILNMVRNTVDSYEGTAEAFLMGLGQILAYAYMVDDNIEYDEVMSDHALFFGAAEEWFDDDDDEDDDDE
jgi:hypothetical protein